jgi:hypothetical protein
MSKHKTAQKRLGKNMRTRSLRAKQRAVALEMVRDLGEVADPFEAERWASWLHGKMWEQRYKAPPTRHLDWALVLGAQIADDIAQLGDPAAKAALHALAWADQGPFGALCEKLISDLADVETPAWALEIGRVELVRAAIDERPDEGGVVIFDVRRHDKRHTLSVLISGASGGIAKHLALMDDFERLPVAGGTASRDGSEFWFVPLDVTRACARARQALVRTDAAEDADVDENYYAHRAMALARISPYLLESSKEEQLAA